MTSETLVLDKDKVRRTDMHFDEIDDTVTFNTVQDVGPMLEENKKKMNEYGDKLSLGKRGEWHHTASIPITIWEKWMQQTNGAIEKDTKLLAAYLNNPDYKYFKVAPTHL